MNYPTAVCENCNRAIFLGPSKEPLKQYKKYDDSWKTVVWRHLHSELNRCDITVATPRKVKDCGVVKI